MKFNKNIYTYFRSYVTDMGFDYLEKDNSHAVGYLLINKKKVIVYGRTYYIKSRFTGQIIQEFYNLVDALEWLAKYLPESRHTINLLERGYVLESEYISFIHEAKKKWLYEKITKTVSEMPHESKYIIQKAFLHAVNTAEWFPNDETAAYTK